MSCDVDPELEEALVCASTLLSEKEEDRFDRGEATSGDATPGVLRSDPLALPVSSTAFHPACCAKFASSAFEWCKAQVRKTDDQSKK